MQEKWPTVLKKANCIEPPAVFKPSTPGDKTKKVLYLVLNQQRLCKYKLDEHVL